MAPVLEIDTEAHAAYLRLTDAAVAVTRQVAPAVYVDLDVRGDVRGIEVLDLEASIPEGALKRDYRLTTADLARLISIRPRSTHFGQAMSSAHTRGPASAVSDRRETLTFA